MTEHGDGTGRLEERIEKLERAVAGLSAEVRTRRLVITDGRDQDRIVGEMVDGLTELRLDLPGRRQGRRTGALVFANPGSEELGLGPGIGFQLWQDGDCVDELTVWSNIDR